MLVGLLLAAAPVADAPMIPAFFTGERLYEICSRPNAGQCSMYVAGVLDGVFLTRSKFGGLALCPQPMNNRDAATAVVGLLASKPELRPHAAAVAVREALSGKLDCEAAETTDSGTR